MKRMTTNEPKGNLETSLNLFYAKDGWTWVRGGGSDPDYLDVSLCDFTRQLILDHISDYPRDDIPTDDAKLGEMVTDWLMDPIDTPGRLIAWLYTAGWAFAELRGRLAAIEDILGDEYDLDRLRELVESEPERARLRKAFALVCRVLGKDDWKQVQEDALAVADT